jgi:hypothetical protein
MKLKRVYIKRAGGEIASEAAHHRHCLADREPEFRPLVNAAIVRIENPDAKP